ncbi:MAG TPA: NfeD family protein [Alphaproteobacteria bacterium]|nr:NfeD family protein [Alphaproteobacteria bacterium]
MNSFASIQFWHWWVLGALLLALEAMAPGAIFLWPGISAGIVGLLLLAFGDISIEAQIVVFAILSLVTVVGWRAYLRWRPVGTDDPRLNRRGEQYVGREFTLAEPIVNGRGRVRIDDTQWRVEGPNSDAGTTVRVTAVNGAILIVKPN